MRFRLSEYGIRQTDFDDIVSAIGYCERNQLTNGRHGILWIYGDNIDELEDYIIRNKDLINDRYMNVAVENEFIYSYGDWIPWSDWFDNV